MSQSSLLRRARTRSVDRAGFSLVELSIVILVMSMLFTMIFGVFFGVSRITSRESPLSQSKQRALLALDNMRSSINQAYFHRDIKRLAFVGKRSGSGEDRRDRLTFASVHQGAAQVGTPAVREVSFYLKPKVGGQESTFTLMRREDQNVDKEPKNGWGGNHYPLLDNVLSLRLRYSLSGKKWEDTWHHDDFRRIPRLVQISLRVKIGNKVQRFETLSYTGLYMY